jgi:ABC-type Fe3+-citrate transport system substrate-binding protein
MKYLVLKNNDIENRLGQHQRVLLNDICETIGNSRLVDGKDKNLYLVLNTDESYAPEVFALMFKHGHTPCNDCEIDNPKVCSHEKCVWLPLLVNAYSLITF